MRKMKKYIDVDELIEFANNHIAGIDANDIARFPRADVKELKHGKWIKKSDDSVVCSECGFFDSYIDEYGDGSFSEYKDENRFCRHCGAKMGIEIERAEK